MNDSNYSRIYNNGYLERNNFQGPPGIKGEKGEVGNIGQQGLRGVMGPIGPPGSIGPRGPRGLNGEQGFQGIKGDNGDRGKEGRIGLKGEIGNKGEIGDTGSIGCQGPKGEIGSQGLTGPTGLHGPYGERGPPGKQGEKGIQGLRGSEGPTGPKGNDGRPGIPGPDGSKGEIGPEGKLGHIGNTGPTGTSIVGVSGTTGGILFKDSNDNNYEISWPAFSTNSNTNNNNNNNNNNQSVFQGLGSLSTVVGNSYYKLSNNKNPSSVEFCINSKNITPGDSSEYEILINKNSSTDIGCIYSDHSDYFKYIRPCMSIVIKGHTTDNNVSNNRNLDQTAEFIITQILLDKLESSEYITIYASSIKFETNAATPELVNNAWYKISIGYLPENGKIGASGADGQDGSIGPTGNTGCPGPTGATGSSIIKKNQVTNIESGCWYRFANTDLNKVLNTFYITNKDTKIILNATINNKLLNEVSINILGNISDSNSIEAIRLLYSNDNNNSYLEYFIKKNNSNSSQENYSIILDSFDNTSHNWNIQDPVRQFLDEANRGNKDLVLQDLQNLNYKIKIIDVNKKNIGITTTNSINSNSIDINNNNIIKLDSNIISLSKSMYTQNYQFSLTLLERNSAIKFNCRGNYTFNEILDSNRTPPSNSNYSLGSFSPIDPLELPANTDINQLNIASRFTQDNNYKDSFICPPYNNPIFQLYKREERSGGSILFTVQRYKENFNYYYQDDIIPEIYRNSYSHNIPQGICFSGNLGIIKNISLNLINDNIYKNINDSPGNIMISNNDVVIQNIQNVLYNVPGYISFRIEIHKYEGINPYINSTRIQYTNWITTSKYQYYIDISKNDWNFENNINTQNYTKGYVNYGDIISIVYKFVITGKRQSIEIRNQLQKQGSNKIKYYPYTIDIQSLKFGVDIQNIEIFN